MNEVSRLTYTRTIFSGADNSLIEKSWGLTVPKHRLDQLFSHCQHHISLENTLHLSLNSSKMSQNGEDTFMEDAPGSQTGETEVADEAPLEKKLFLVCVLPPQRLETSECG